MSRPPRRPAPPRHTVAVDIAGEKHVLRSDVPPEYTRAVAAHVDATIRALPGFQTLEPFRAATLAALSITDELFRAREEIRRLREEAEYRTNILAEQLEAAAAAAAEKRPVRRPGASSASASWTAEPESGTGPVDEASPAPGGAPAPAPVVTPQPAAPSPAPPPVTPRSAEAPAHATAPPRTAEAAPVRTNAELPPELHPPPLRGNGPAWQEDEAPAPDPRSRRDGDDPELDFPPPE